MEVVGSSSLVPLSPQISHRSLIEAGPRTPVAFYCQKETKHNSFLLTLSNFYLPRHCSIHPTFQQLLGRQLGNQIGCHIPKDKTDHRLPCFYGETFYIKSRALDFHISLRLSVTGMTGIIIEQLHFSENQTSLIITPPYLTGPAQV